MDEHHANLAREAGENLPEGQGVSFWFAIVCCAQVVS